MRRLGSIILLAFVMALLCWRQSSSFAQTSSPWSAPIDVSAPQTVGSDLSGLLLCDTYQNLHILWGKSHEQGSEIYYRTDAKGSLSSPRDVLALSDPLAIRLRATISESDFRLHLTWQNNYIRPDVFYSHVPLANAGDTRAWSAPRLLVTRADSSSIVAEKSGALSFIYGVSDADGLSSYVYYIRSDDGGFTWSEPSLIHEVSSVVPSTVSAGAAIDGTGRIHIGITIRSQEYGIYSELGYVRSLDGGKTWEPYITIAEQNDATPNVSVIAPYAFGDSEIHFTWHDPRRMHMWSGDGGATWSHPTEIIKLGAGFGGANSLAKDSADRLHVLVGVKNGVYAAEWDGYRWTRHVQIENRSMDPHGQRLAVCQGNQLHAVYDDRVEEDTTVWYAQRQLDAPHIPQSPLPNSGPAAAVIPTSESGPVLPLSTVEPAALQAIPDFDKSAPTGNSTNPSFPVLAAVISALAPLAIYLGSKKIRSS
jgi:hypothetical protein